MKDMEEMAMSTFGYLVPLRILQRLDEIKREMDRFEDEADTLWQEHRSYKPVPVKTPEQERKEQAEQESRRVAAMFHADRVEERRHRIRGKIEAANQRLWGEPQRQDYWLMANTCYSALDTRIQPFKGLSQSIRIDCGMGPVDIYSARHARFMGYSMESLTAMVQAIEQNGRHITVALLNPRDVEALKVEIEERYPGYFG